MKNILSVARTITFILVGGFCIASTSRVLHDEPVVPYYAQLAEQTVKASNHIKQAITEGKYYAGAASK